MSSCTTQPKKENSVIVSPLYKPVVPDLDWESFQNIYNEDGTIQAKVIPYEAWKQIALFMILSEEAETALSSIPN